MKLLVQSERVWKQKNSKPSKDAEDGFVLKLLCQSMSVRVWKQKISKFSKRAEDGVESRDKFSEASGSV